MLDSWSKGLLLTPADDVSLLTLNRFFLGVCEAAISPAFSLITAMWYKPAEQPLRFAVWYASTGLGGLVGSIATWGIGHIVGALNPWQYQFIILGAITVAWGFVVLYLLPDNPVQARFLSQPAFRGLLSISFFQFVFPFQC